MLEVGSKVIFADNHSNIIIETLDKIKDVTDENAVDKTFSNRLIDGVIILQGLRLSEKSVDKRLPCDNNTVSTMTFARVCLKYGVTGLDLVHLRLYIETIKLSCEG